MECTVYTPCGSFAVHFRSDGESTFLLHVRSCVMESTARDSAPPHSSADGDAAQLFSASLTPEAVEQITSAAGLRKNFRTFAEMTYNALIGSSTCLRFFVESPEALQRRIHEDVAQREAQRRDIETSSSPPAPAPALAAVPALSKPSAGDSDMLLTVDYDVDFTRAIFPLPLTKAPRSEGLRMEVRASVAHSPAEDREVVPARVDRTQHQLDRQHLAEALRLIQVLNGENATLKKENRMLAHLTREKMAEMQQLCKAFEEGAAAIAEVQRLREKNIRLRMELQKAKEHVEEVEAAMSRLRRQTAVPCGSSRHISPSSRRSRAPLESRDVNLLPVGSRGRPAKRSTRLDTPPPPPRESIHPRLSATRSPSLEGRPGGQRGRLGSGAPPRRTHSASSRGSCSSHERLYMTTTASSRKKAVPARSGSLDSDRLGRPVFRSL